MSGNAEVDSEIEHRSGRSGTVLHISSPTQTAMQETGNLNAVVSSHGKLLAFNDCSRQVRGDSDTYSIKTNRKRTTVLASHNISICTALLKTSYSTSMPPPQKHLSR